MFFENVRVLCKERRITFAELERTLGLGNGIIARWADAKRGPSIYAAKRVADYFGVTVDWLLEHKA